MMSRLIMLRCMFAVTALAACAVVRADTVSGDSLPFVLDTRIDGASAAAESPAFVIDTRSGGLTATADSGTFILDTRGGIGLGGAGESGIFTIDTRGGRIACLVVSGPERVSPGTSAAFTCEARYADGARADVTALCSWGLAGAYPTGTAMFGNVLSAPHVPSATYVYARAIYDRADGRIVSDPFEVAIRSGLAVRLGEATVRPVPGQAGQWRLDIEAVASGGMGYVSHSWKIGNVSLTGPYGAVLFDYLVTGEAGSRLITVEAADGHGCHASATRWVAFNRPPVTNQPEVRYPAADVGLGRLLDQYGNDFAFDGSRIANGLIILTHGLNSSGTDLWIKNMANTIEWRLNKDGKPLPNIAIYDWKEGANPSSFYGGGQWWNPLTGAEGSRYNGAYDIVNIKPVALDFGRSLASDLAFEMLRSPPRIATSAPIHLIGHSAGGFVLGECATLLKSRGYMVDRVTMLDTPQPERRHFTSYPNPGVVERYISSIFGYTATTLLGVFPGTYYIREDVPDWLSTYPNPVDGHAYSHHWYHFRTALMAEETGFYRSPFLYGPRIDRALPFRGATVNAQPVGTDRMPLDGFETFGSVLRDGLAYTVSEEADAGLFAEFVLPVGVQTLEFRYRFIGAGDGDFLTLHWRDYSPLYLGSDSLLARDGFISAEVDLSPFAGESGRMVFTLVSRGTANAVLQISDIVLTVSNDPDGDGLTTEEELALGTDPLVWDTDGDGIGDGDEVNLYGTNPLLADSDGDGVFDGHEVAAGTDPRDPQSYFRVTRTQAEPGGLLTIVWNSKSGRSYRINRRTDLFGPNYDTIASGVPGEEPVTSVTIEESPSVGRAFYWVELE